MTDNLFGYSADLPPLDEGPDDEEDYDFENYNSVNDDTFGTGAEVADWEDAHERMAEEFKFPDDDQLGEEDERMRRRIHQQEEPNRRYSPEEDLEKSISQLVLDDDDSYYDPAIKKSSQSQPISIKSVGESSISQLFGPSSPPSLFDPSDFMSPTRNIWGSPQMSQPVQMPQRSSTAMAEDRLKAMLNIGTRRQSGGGSDAWEDPAIVRAISDPQPTKKKIMSLAELEQELTGQKPSSKALPARSVSPDIGSPPTTVPLPIGTPPRGGSHLHQGWPPSQHGQQQGAQHQQQKQYPQHVHAATPPNPPSMPPPQTKPPVPLHPQLLQQLTRQIHQSIGGRVSPTQISQLIVHLHASGGRISPNSIRQAVFTTIPPPQTIPHRPPNQHQQGGVASSPGFGSNQRPPFHAGSPGMPYSSSPRGIPRGPGPGLGTSPGSQTPPVHMGQGRGRGGFPRGMHGLTPMNPRIPPVHSRPDQGGMNRRYPYSPQQRGPHPNMQRYHDRGDGPRAQRQIRFPRGNQHRVGNRGDYDEYACLMSQKEKEWVIKIQMLQLTSNNPNVDDFYYQMFMQKKAAREKDKEKNGEGNHHEGGKDGKHEKKLLLRPLENRSYQPAQFEGALGKLTSASVNNPRQIIDIHIDNPIEEEEAGKPGAKDHGRRRRTLLAIEKVYGIVLDIEEVDMQVLGLPESDRGPLLEKRRSLVSQMVAMIKGDGALKDRGPLSNLPQMLGIRKGRKLVGRILPLIGKEEGLPLMQTFLQNMSYVLKQEAKDLKRDAQENQKGRTEETLPQLYPPIHQFIHSCDLGDLTSLVDHLLTAPPSTPSTTQPKASQIVSGAIQNRLGVSIILSLVNHAEELYSSSPQEKDPRHRQWVNCVDVLAQAICVVADTAIAKPLGRFPNVLDHFKRFVSKQPLNALEKRLRNLIVNEE